MSSNDSSLWLLKFYYINYMNNIILRRYVMSYEYISDSHFYTFWERDMKIRLTARDAY